MAAITITHDSDQAAQVKGNLHQPLSPVDNGARVRTKRFTVTVPTGGVAINGRIELLRFPKSQRILEGAIKWEAGTSAATGTLSVGHTGLRDPNDDNEGSLASALDTAGSAAAARIPALGNVIDTAEATVIYASAKTAALVAGKKFSGYVLYVENT